MAAGWKGLGFPRLTVITDSAASAGVDGGARMARNVAATKVCLLNQFGRLEIAYHRARFVIQILTGPELAKTHRVVPVHGPALILAEGDDDSSEEPQERDFTTEDLKKLLAAYEEASINGDEAME